MLNNNTVLSVKKVGSVLTFFLIVIMLVSGVANAAAWGYYDNQKDAVVFDYTDISDFMSTNNFYMEVSFVKDNNYSQNGVVVKRYNDLNGHFYATANGLYTIRFYRPDGEQFLSFYQTNVTQIQEETWSGGSDGSGTIGYDGSPSNTGGDPADGGGGDPPGDGGDDPGGGDGGDGGDNGDGSDGGCECIFKSPHWEEYMGKIDELINKIPPPPNWNQVADTFNDHVVPKLVNDLRNMLGTAPAPPSSPAIIEPINQPKPNKPAILDYADKLNDIKPQMQANPALSDSEFTADDVRNQAPEIEFREDESGGFDLPTGNPVNSLPDLPFEDFPMPGMESAGEWDHQPQQPDNPYPMPSGSGGGNTDPGTPPIPSESGNEAPLPGQDYNAPIPGGVDIPLGNYKKHPNDPDGSG